MLFAENTANYDADDSGNFGHGERVRGGEPRAEHRPGRLAVHQPHGRRASTGRPPAGSDAESGAGTVAIPTEFTGNFFGGTMPNTTYFGAADPAGAKWWQGWTNYATQ